MPVSKRDKKVSLTQVKKKGMELKRKVVEDIRKSLDTFDGLYVFNVSNMRHGPMSEIREEWKGSRFFMAKRKVMAIALGRTKETALQKNLHKVAAYLTGACGLLFTNKPKSEVTSWFENFSRVIYAKSGSTATETVVLPAGPLPDFSFSLEPHLRALGLPTQLVKGTIVLREDYLVCAAGAKLTPEQAQILKQFGKTMTEFKPKLVCFWRKEDGYLEAFQSLGETRKSITKTSAKSPATKIFSPKDKSNISERQDDISNQTQVEQEDSVMEQSVLQEKTPKKSPSSKKPLSEEADLVTINTKNNSKSESLNTEKEIVEQDEDEEKQINEKSHIKNKIKSPLLEQKVKTPKKVVKGENSNLRKISALEMQEDASSDSPALASVDETEEEEKTMKVDPSPKLGKGNPRRSMRTPKPIKRTPEQRRMSIKKLTESAKTKNATPKQVKGTPRRQSTRMAKSSKAESDVDME